MIQINKVELIGRLTGDPNVFRNGESVTARFGLAVDRRYKKEGDEVTADFPNIVVFGKTAEFAEKYLAKGKKIGLVGRIQTGKYTNKDGHTVYTTDVVGDELEFVESKAAAGGNGQQAGPPQAQPPGMQQAPPQAAPQVTPQVTPQVPKYAAPQPQQPVQPQGYPQPQGYSMPMQQQGYYQQAPQQGYAPQPQGYYQQPVQAQPQKTEDFMEIPDSIMDGELPF